MDLGAAVRKYLASVGEFGRPLHLSEFELPKDEIERIFSAWDEDYQISRYLLLTRAPDEELEAFPPHARVYAVNGHESSHVTFRADIERLIAPP